MPHALGSIGEIRSATGTPSAGHATHPQSAGEQEKASPTVRGVLDWKFVGTVFVAFATTLPEMVVTVSALRMGALDMAIGNLFGSCLFNVLVLAIDDAIYVKGSLLAHVSPLHAISAVSAMIMMGAAIVGLLYRPDTRLLKAVGWVSLFLVMVYVMNSYVLYLYGGHG